MIEVGYAEADITPSASVDLCGFTLRQGPGTTVYDPLKIRWLALRNNAESAVLLGSADLISFSRQTFQNLRNDLCEGVNDGEDYHVGLATTHTHSGPATVKLRHCGRMDRRYIKHTKSQIVEAGRAAVKSTPASVKIVYGSGDCDVNINRRHGESGPVDNEVIVVGLLDDKSGKPVATLVNYACHPVVLGYNSNGVSADYPGYLTAHMQKETGAPCVFLNGACGDVNPRNDKSIDPSEPRKTGEAVAKAAIKALKHAQPVENDVLGWHHKKIILPVRRPKSAADFTNRLAMLEKCFGISQSLFADRVARDVRRLAEGTYPETITIELSLLTIGDRLGVLFVPGELFSSLGLRIKELALPRKLLISGFSNGSVGYLPDRQAYKDGGYEPHFSNFFYDFPELDPTVGDVVVDGASALLKKADLAVAI